MAREVPPPFCWAQSEAGREAVSSARRVHPRTRAGGGAGAKQVDKLAKRSPSGGELPHAAKFEPNK